MAFNVNTFVPQKINRVIHTTNKGETNWYTNQVQDFSIKVDGQEQTKEDANGNTIATITKGKTCSVSFATPVYDLNIIAAVNGTSKKIAGVDDVTSLVSPSFEEFVVTDHQTTVVIANNAIANTISVQTITTDGSLKNTYKVGASATKGVVTYTDSTKTITFASSDLTAGDTVLVKYDYNATEAVGFTASGNDFPNAGRMYVEVEGFDICDQSTKIYAYYRFPTAKMKSSYQTDIKLDATYNIEMDCAVDYCDKEKQFYSVVIPNKTTA